MKIQENISLRRYNTFGIDKKARLFLEANRSDEVIQAISHARSLGKKLFVLGGGSNILLVQDIDALVIKINIQGIEKIEEDADSLLLKAGAGVVWHDLVTFSLASGLSGLENLSLIPGTVGAAPMQNIGAYGVEIESVFDHLDAIEIASRQTKRFYKADCAFGYRESIFKNRWKGKYIITHVALRLSKKPRPTIDYGDIQGTLQELGNLSPTPENISKAVISIRQRKLPDPAKIGNAGSFFKNPTVPVAAFERLRNKFPGIPGYPLDKSVKIPAAWLIEQAGWKGKRFGNIGVHEHQPLVLVNHGNGEGSDLIDLSKKIQADIYDKYGITLEREVNLISPQQWINP
ncbi:UDP-N-acetylmuramate dehydrogenase [Cyclobacterium roseum]|uniref:UDP-N-acetylmuramate dehydrogenase n=1 Tax=Cyclobacterium roseum TaxID=2666137 RepID=UPI001390F343|nr:UDP-N-acetylmuramate dehydrogenase [Cyclobacterium roseum]